MASSTTDTAHDSILIKHYGDQEEVMRGFNVTAENDLGHTSSEEIKIEALAGEDDNVINLEPNYLSDEEDLEYKVDAALVAICEFEAEETAICSMEHDTNIFAVNLKQEINKLKQISCVEKANKNRFFK